nr:MAG TPA: hypothetical protein [Siphoviridae sp. ctYuc6]
MQNKSCANYTKKPLMRVRKPVQNNITTLRKNGVQFE